MNTNPRLQRYYYLTKNAPASPLLKRALLILERKRGTIIDLGCGAGRDTKYLLNKGFIVTAVDQNSEAKKILIGLPNQDRLTCVISTFDKFNFGKYDVVSAQWSLPFNPPGSFNKVFTKIKKSINPGGVFVGQLFGEEDEWKVPGTKMTFHTRREAKELLKGLKVLEFGEEKRLGSLADGTPKYWHVFHIIAQKPKVAHSLTN